MKTQRLSILCLATLMAACGGNKAAPPTNPAPAASAAPPVAQYKSAFEKGTTEKWTPVHGNWWTKDGVYQQDHDSLEGTKTMLSLPDAECFTFQFKARTTKPTSGGFMAIAKYQKKYVWWRIGAESNMYNKLEGAKDVGDARQAFTVKDNVWYKVKVIVNRDRITGWLDDAQKWSIRKTPEEVNGLEGDFGKDLVGLAGIGTWNAAVQFSDVEVTPTCPQ